MLVPTIIAACLFTLGGTRDPESCVNKFCPMGTYCETRHIAHCPNPPCKPVLACLPAEINGCNNKTCLGSEVCVEHTIPCIGRMCKKVAVCAKAGTCEAMVCPPSHKCKMDGGAPKCVKTIFTISDVADLSKFKDDH